MRPFLFMCGFVLAAGAADAGPAIPWQVSGPQAHPSIVGIGAASRFEFRYNPREFLASQSLDHADGPGMSIVPSINIGPIHAFIGGHIRPGGLQVGGGNYWGASQPHASGPGPDLELDAGHLWGGQVGGSATTRGVKFTFTLPMQQ